MEIDYDQIGIRIRRYRKEKGLTQAALAEKADIEPSNISHIERGATKLGLPTIVSIANALEVTVDDLLCDSLVAAKESYDKEASTILADCSHSERKLLTDVLRSVKESIRRNGGLGS